MPREEGIRNSSARLCFALLWKWLYLETINLGMSGASSIHNFVFRQKAHEQYIAMASGYFGQALKELKWGSIFLLSGIVSRNDGLPNTTPEVMSYVYHHWHHTYINYDVNRLLNVWLRISGITSSDKWHFSCQGSFQTRGLYGCHGAVSQPFHIICAARNSQLRPLLWPVKLTHVSSLSAFYFNSIRDDCRMTPLKTR